MSKPCIIIRFYLVAYFVSGVMMVLDSFRLVFKLYVTDVVYAIDKYPIKLVIWTYCFYSQVVSNTIFDAGDVSKQAR